MTDVTNSAEGGTSGTTVTTGNSGGSSGTAFDTAQAGAGSTLKFDNTHAAHGGLSYAFVETSPATSVLLTWSTSLTSSPVSKLWFRAYVYITAFPASTVRLIRTTQSGTLAAGIGITAAGKITTLNSAGTAITTSTTVVPLNQWFRIEGFVIGSATVGQIEVQIFTTDKDAVTPDETKTTAASQNTLGTLTAVSFGNPSSTTNNTIWLDDLGGSTTAYLGPSTSEVTGTISMKKFTLSGSATGKSQATASISMKKMSLSGSSAEKAQITGAISMKKMRLSGSGTEKSQATVAIKMKKMSLSGSGTGSSQATVAISMKKMSLSGSSAERSDATAAISMKKMSLSGSSAERSDATAAISMKKMSLSGSSAERSDISAAISMKKMSIAASVTVSSGADEFTGAISMKKFRLSGSGTGKSAATGAISMKKFRLSGSATGKSTAAVVIAMKKMSLSAAVIDPVTKLQNTGEGGTSGTSVTTGNSGGVSGSAFDSVQATSGGAVTFDNAHSAHGGLSYKIVTGGTAGNSLLEWTTTLTGSTVPKVWFRVYCYFTAFSGTVRIVAARNGSTTRAIVAINSSGKVQSLNAAGTALKTSTLSVPTNQWFRIEGFFIGDASVGQVEFKLFTTAMDELVPDEVQTSAATQNTGGTINRIDYGNPSSVSSYTFWIDDLAASLTGYLGPRVVDSTIAISMKKFKLASSVAGHSAATVAIRMKKMSLSGSSAEKSQATVAIRMKKMRLSGSSTEKSQATISISMKKMRIAVVVSDAGLTELTGLVVMKKMRLSGVSHEHAYLTGHVVMKKMTLAIDVEAPVETHVTVVIVMKKMTFRSHIRQHGASELFIFSPV